jgi:hypothetical protein
VLLQCVAAGRSFYLDLELKKCKELSQWVMALRITVIWHVALPDWVSSYDVSKAPLFFFLNSYL